MARLKAPKRGVGCPRTQPIRLPSGAGIHCVLGSVGGGDTELWVLMV
jgi:hypothetical protein